MKHEWIIRLKQIKMRRNEDPLLVWQKFLTILDKVDGAINYLNSDLDEDSPKRLPNISDDLKHEILSGIFIRNNNQMRCSNVGTINKRTRKYIASKDPTAWKDWKLIFTAMELELIPQCYQTLPEYQYQSYPFCPDDYNIYLSPKKRKPRMSKDSYEPNPNCPRDEHLIERSQHEFGEQSEEQETGNDSDKTRHFAHKSNSGTDAKDERHQSHHKLFCRRCERNNHNEKDCRATRYYDGTPIKDDKSNEIREGYRLRNEEHRGRDRHKRDRYNSRRRDRLSSRSRSRDRNEETIERSQHKLERSQHKFERSHPKSRVTWGDKGKDEDLSGGNENRNKCYRRSIAALSKEVNEDLSLDADQAEQIQEYITKIAELTALHSQSR